MKKILYITLAVTTALSFCIVSCKEKAIESTQEDSNPVSLDPSNPLLVPTPKGYYEPKGLRKLSILEMYEIGTSGMFKKDFPVKDRFGNAVSWDIMDNPEKVMFMQMYVNEAGQPVEAVVYEITDDIRNQILKVRLFAKPKESDSSKATPTPPPAEE